MRPLRPHSHYSMKQDTEREEGSMHIHIHLPHYSSRLQQDERHVQWLQSCLHSNKHPASTEALLQNTGGGGNSRAKRHLEGLRAHSVSGLLTPSTTRLLRVHRL